MLNIVVKLDRDKLQRPVYFNKEIYITKDFLNNEYNINYFKKEYKDDKRLWYFYLKSNKLSLK